MIPRELELLAEAILSAKAGDSVKALGLCTTYLDVKGPPMWLAARDQVEDFVAALVQDCNEGKAAGFDWTAERVRDEVDALTKVLGAKPVFSRVEIDDHYQRVAWFWTEEHKGNWLAWIVDKETRMARAMLHKPPHGFTAEMSNRIGLECDAPHAKNNPHLFSDCTERTMAERMGGDLA